MYVFNIQQMMTSCGPPPLSSINLNQKIYLSINSLVYLFIYVWGRILHWCLCYCRLYMIPAGKGKVLLASFFFSICSYNLFFFGFCFFSPFFYCTYSICITYTFVYLYIYLLNKIISKEKQTLKHKYYRTLRIL